jgi:DNA-binding CsgD family transcriptional regulator
MPLSLVIQALCCVDEIGAAEAATDEAITAARRHGSVLTYALVSYHRAIPRYHRGALLEALADIDQVRMVREEGWVGADGWTAQLSARLHLERDDRTAARCSIDLAAGVSPDSIDYPVALYGRAELALADDQPGAALTAASTSGELLANDFGIDHPGMFPWRCTAALAAHRLGDNRQAGQLAHQALDQARSLGVPRPLAHALRTAAHLNPGPGGLDVLMGSPALLEQTAVLVDLGAAQRQVGDKPGALKTLRRGYAQADSLQLTALSNRARRQLHALGSRPRRAALTGAGALTPTERRVADMASSGLTNSEVAQALFVTPKTVETHLANAYRKLAIATRRELPAALTSRTQ